MDDPVCDKYSKWNISLWDDFTMGKPQSSWEKEYLIILGIFWFFLGNVESHKGLKGPQDGKLCAMKSGNWIFYYEIISLWEKLGINVGQRTIEWLETCYGHFQALRALPKPPEGPQLFQMDNLVFHENSRRDILQWEDFTMGTPGDIYMESGQRIVWWFEACFRRF